MINNLHIKKRYISRIAALAAVMVICACLVACEKKPVEKVTIAFSATHYAALADVAQVKGYFLQEGLEVTVHMHLYGKLALQDMIEGKADFATVAETPVMFAILNGSDIAIISTLHTTSKDNAIVVRKDKGISAPSDLKGRKIAATLGTTSEFFMDTFLAVHGISRKLLQVTDMKQEDMSAALAKGEVDAIAVFNPFLLQAQRKVGSNGNTFYDNIYSQTFNIVSTKKFLSDNQSGVKKILKALVKAEEFYKQNPEELLKIVADFNRLDIADVREMLAGTTIALSLDQSLILSLEDESEWAIKYRMSKATKIPNYLDYVYIDGLKSVKSDAVRILR